VPVAHLLGLAALLKLLAGVLADGLEHPVAHSTVRNPPDHYERLVDQPPEKIEYVFLFDGAPRAHRLHRLQRPPPGECR
jgi:hypothetical protein